MRKNLYLLLMAIVFSFLPHCSSSTKDKKQYRFNYKITVSPPLDTGGRDEFYNFVSVAQQGNWHSIVWHSMNPTTLPFSEYLYDDNPDPDLRGISVLQGDIFKIVVGIHNSKDTGCRQVLIESYIDDKPFKTIALQCGYKSYTKTYGPLCCDENYSGEFYGGHRVQCRFKIP